MCYRHLEGNHSIVAGDEKEVWRSVLVDKVPAGRCDVIKRLGVNRCRFWFIGLLSVCFCIRFVGVSLREQTRSSFVDYNND